MVIERRRETAFAVLIIVLGLFAGIVRSAAAGTDSPVPAVNARQGIGLKGYDPVAYFINGAPTKGSEQYSLRLERRYVSICFRGKPREVQGRP